MTAIDLDQEEYAKIIDEQEKLLVESKARNLRCSILNERHESLKNSIDFESLHLLRNEMTQEMSDCQELEQKFSNLKLRMKSLLIKHPHDLRLEALFSKTVLQSEDWKKDFVTPETIPKVMEQTFPELFKLFYPRQYENIGNYPSPKVLAGFLTLLTKQAQEDFNNISTANKLIIPGLRSMIDKKMPLLFISPKLMVAIEKSDFASDINWVDLNLPYEQGCFVLPKNSLSHPKDGDVAFIMWSRIKPGSYQPPTSLIPRIEITQTAISLVALCPKTGVWYDSNLVASHSPTLKLRNLFNIGEDEEIPLIKLSDKYDGVLDEGDSDFIEKLGVILFGTFLVISARPSLNESGKRLKIITTREGIKKEFWSPNIIGRNYYVKKDKTGGHSSPRLHWRRGHFRNQAFGVGLTERKVLWIEPMLVGVKEEKKKRRN